jgi:hypothetical protein
MSETFGNPTAATARADEPSHEAYSFACLSCGHGWEQQYAIEHRTDADGRAHCVYLADGVRVPSPLTSPSCPGCGGSHVRIMRAGRVAEVDTWWHRTPERGAAAGSPGPNAATMAPDTPPRTAHRLVREHHARRLHLPFHFHLRRYRSTPEA